MAKLQGGAAGKRKTPMPIGRAGIPNQYRYSGTKPANVRLPDFNVKMPDVSKAASGVGDFVRTHNPIDMLYNEVGKRIKQATGQR